jgi:hypothetical protein
VNASSRESAVWVEEISRGLAPLLTALISFGNYTTASAECISYNAAGLLFLLGSRGIRGQVADRSEAFYIAKMLPFTIYAALASIREVGQKRQRRENRRCIQHRFKN